MTYSKTAIIGICMFVCFFVSSLTGSKVSFAACAVLALCGIVVRFTIKNKNAVFAFVAAVASFLFYGIYSLAFIEPTALLAGNTYEMTLSAVSVSAASHGAEYVTAEGIADGIPVKMSFYASDSDIKAGDTVNAEITFSEMPHTASYNDIYNYSRGIYLRAYADSAFVSGEGSPTLSGILSDYSAYLRERTDEELDSGEAGLLKAVFFGDKSGLTGRLSAAVRKAGLSHLTAVSGMHFSLILIVVMTVLGTLPIGRNRAAVFGTAVLLSVVFAVFFNMTASVRRSAVMMIIYYASALFRRKSSVSGSLGAAVMIILLCEPYACRDTGMLLSVCGTFGAGSVSPAVCRYIERRRKVSKPIGAIITCICASYCTIPVVTLVFGGFSLWSPITTVLVYPFFAAALVFMLLFTLTGGIFGSILLIPAGAAIKPVITVINAVSDLRYGYIMPDSEIFPGFAVISGIMIAVVAVLVRRRVLRGRFLIYSCTAVFCVLTGGVTLDRLNDRDTARITVYSDGRNYLAALEYRSGVSLFASGVSSKLSDEAYDIMSERCIDCFDLICVFTEKERVSAYSEAFAELPAHERRFMDNSEYVYDVGGIYTVTAYEDAIETEINGTDMIFTEMASAPVYGGHDVAVYSGYKKSESYDINGVTVLSDKRCGSPDNAYSAYYNDIEIRIDAEGRIRVRDK